MARPDLTSSWGEGGVNSLPSLESAPGLWGRIWGIADPSSPMKPDVPGPGVGSPPYPQSRPGGGPGRHIWNGGPHRGHAGRPKDPCPAQSCPQDWGKPHHWGTLCEGTGREPQPHNKHRLHCLEHRMPQDRLGAGHQGHTWRGRRLLCLDQETRVQSLPLWPQVSRARALSREHTGLAAEAERPAQGPPAIRADPHTQKLPPAHRSPRTHPLPTQPLGKPTSLHQPRHCPPEALSPPGPGHLCMTQGQETPNTGAPTLNRPARDRIQTIDEMLHPGQRPKRRTQGAARPGWPTPPAGTHHPTPTPSSQQPALYSCLKQRWGRQMSWKQERDRLELGPRRLDFGQILSTVKHLHPGAPGPLGRDPS